MKRILTLICSLMIATMALFGSACKPAGIPSGPTGGGGNNGGGDGNIVVDTTKTQLYVANLQGGIGYEWFRKAIARFEEKFADAVYEPGTKGVQIIPEDEYTVNGRWLLLPTDMYDVYFTENLTYNEYVRKGELLDLTDVIKAPAKTSPTTSESVTIESKLNADQKSGLTAQNGNYYAIPHYQAFRGLSYDVDLFNENRLFLAADKNNGNGGFIIRENDVKSVGPNGVAGDYDDGLPATIDEFFALCEKMCGLGIIPFVWPGQAVSYTEYLCDAIADNLGGVDAVRLNYTYDSGAKKTKIITGFDSSNNPIVDEVTITTDNGYLLKQQYGKYYGLEVLERVIDKIDSYAHALSNNDSNFTQYNSQEEYIYSNLENKPIGMIIDGTYWWNEAKGAYNRSVAKYGERAKVRNFAWMPMPTAVSAADQATNAKDPVVRDIMNSYCIVNAKVADNQYKAQLAKDFVSFCYTDESLQEFTTTTGVAKGLNYSLTEAQYNSLSPFAKSCWDFRAVADIVSILPGSVMTIENEQSLLWDLFTTSISGQAYNTPFYAYLAKESSEDYFKGQWISDSTWRQNYERYFTVGM
ncbi:MAG: extracellular solute-binding protein [Clostridia bacterium]|nr:extracellular solute-binding protein [Clostridia bacterium]